MKPVSNNILLVRVNALENILPFDLGTRVLITVKIFFSHYCVSKFRMKKIFYEPELILFQ